MTYFSKFRLTLVSVISVLATSVPLTASAQFAVHDPISFGNDIGEFIEEIARWEREISHYTDQVNAYRDQFNQAQDLYDQLNSLKFADLLNSDASGSLARARLQSMYDGSNETFGLGLPDLPTEGQLRYYGNKGFMPTERLYPGDIPDAQLASDQGKVSYSIETVQSATKDFVTAKNTRMTNLSAEYSNAIDMKANMELNNALLRENVDIMLQLLTLENARAGRDVTDITKALSLIHI